jgi:hypothetical protein
MKLVKFVALGIVICSISLTGIACEEAKKADKSIVKDVKAMENWTVEEYHKHISSHYPAIEDKIKTLSAKEKEGAEETYKKLKEKMQSIREATPEKYKEAKEETSKLFSELKEKLGMK